MYGIYRHHGRIPTMVPSPVLYSTGNVRHVQAEGSVPPGDWGGAAVGWHQRTYWRTVAYINCTPTDRVRSYTQTSWWHLIQIQQQKSYLLFIDDKTPQRLWERSSRRTLSKMLVAHIFPLTLIFFFLCFLSLLSCLQNANPNPNRHEKLE